MIKKFRTYLWVITITLLTAPVSVLAQGDLPNEGNGDTVTLENPLGEQDIENILNQIIDWLLIIAAPIAIIMTIWAGYLFMTAGDNEDKVKKARTTLLYVVIGIAVLILSKGIITLVASLLA